MKSQILGRYILCPLCIVIAWFATATYTFNKKADLNGDNFYYYITASAMASGQGYVDLSKVDDPTTDVDERITATYPPGYPILMTPLRFITDSIIAQKWQNELCILASLLLLYFMLLRIGLSVPIAFISTFAGAFIPRVLHFSTMMMSESAFCLTAILVFYFLLRASENEDKWYSELRQPWIWLSIGCLIINYHVRTQGLALLAGVLFGLLIRRRWAAIGAMIGGFIVGYLPWKIRNQVLGLSNSRYLDMVMLSNPWRPEEGSLTITEFIGRFFETLKMLVFTALPNSILPFAECNPDQPEYSIGLYILGIVMIILIVVGCLQLGKIKWCVLGYIAATFGIISVFSTPSGNREEVEPGTMVSYAYNDNGRINRHLCYCDVGYTTHYKTRTDLEQNSNCLFAPTFVISGKVGTSNRTSNIQHALSSALCALLSYWKRFKKENTERHRSLLT